MDSRWTSRALAGALLALAARSLMLHAPQPEAAALERAERWLAPRVQPGDLVVHADAHSLLYARHYPEDRAQHLLLVTAPNLPYYEGEQVIPREWRITPEAFARDVAGGRRWWGLHERYGYPGAEPATDLLRRAATGDSIRIDRVFLWAGTAGQSVR